MKENINKMIKTSAKTNVRKQADIMIPKYRFDQINLCLKETKQALKEKVLESEKNKNLTVKLKKDLLISQIETVLAKHGIEDLTVAKTLIDFSNVKPENDGFAELEE